MAFKPIDSNIAEKEWVCYGEYYNVPPFHKKPILNKRVTICKKLNSQLIPAYYQVLLFVLDYVYSLSQTQKRDAPLSFIWSVKEYLEQFEKCAASFDYVWDLVIFVLFIKGKRKLSIKQSERDCSY